MKLITSLILFLMLTACQSTLIHSNGNYIEADAQATIEILQPLKVHPESARAFLQYGELQPKGRLNLYEVNCEVEINTVSEQPQTIPPGVFRIISIVQDESPIVLLKAVKLAALNVSWSDDASPVDIMRFYRFYLQPLEPDSQSDVRSITCRGAQSEPFNAELPSLQEMQAASGLYLKFNL